MASREPLRTNTTAVVVCTSPDVCTKDGKPVPYDVYSLGADDTRASADVRFTGNRAGNAASRLAVTYGDQPADAGVRSTSVGGFTRPSSDFVSTVLVNGHFSVRQDTIFEMNCPNPEGLYNTKGKLIYPGPGPGGPKRIPRSPEERARMDALEKLKDRFDGDDFYGALAEFDPANKDFWNDMKGVQASFKEGEFGRLYDADTVTYSQSMRQTLHGSVINLFEDPKGLAQITGRGPDGLRDWYIDMHATAFDNNGAWNRDSLVRRGAVGVYTPFGMATEGLTLVKGLAREIFGSEDPYAADAARRVRAMRMRAGLPVSRLPGDKLPSVMDKK